MKSTPVIQLQQLEFGYGGQTIVRIFDLTVAKSEILSLLGPSGSGKTSVLRLIAGLERPTSGRILLRGQNVADPDFHWVPPEHRKLALVQQDYALFPHLTVAQNIAFGLTHINRRQQNDRVENWLQQVGLQAKKGRLPSELSGGEQQRVAIARALITEPDLVLLDEPFSSLDSHLRQQLSGQLKAWLQLTETAAVVVTHDQSEAMQIADRIGVLDRGQLQQVATPEALLRDPVNRFVAEFVGGGKWLPLEHRQGKLHCAFGYFDPAGTSNEQACQLLVHC